MATTSPANTKGEEGRETDAEERANEHAETIVETPEEPLELSKDVIFELLKVERRRDVLTYLDENGGETTLGDVAEYIAARENGIEVGQLSSSQRKRVYVALYQCHLPKMDDTNVIDYNRPRGTIELRPEAEQLFPYLYLDPSAGDHAHSRWKPFERALANLASTIGT